MGSFVKVVEKTILGYECEAKLSSNGLAMHRKLGDMHRQWWCGYITVPASHPWAREKATCHGGLTYGREVRSPAGMLVGMKLGFDCAHWGDPEVQGDEYEFVVWQNLESLAAQALEAAKES